MSTNSKYFNEYGSEITSTQAEQLATFYIMIYENGEEKRYETYQNGLKIHISHYISSEMEIANILSNEPNASFTITSNHGNYKVADVRGYSSQVLTRRKMFTYDTLLNELICMQIMDPITGTAVHNRTEKYYFDENGTEVYSFSYNQDGSCLFIEKVQEYQADFYATAIGNDPDVDFTWQGFEYYQNSEPLIPGGITA